MGRLRIRWKLCVGLDWKNVNGRMMKKLLFGFCLFCLSSLSTAHSNDKDCETIESSIWWNLYNIEHSLSEKDQVTSLIQAMNDSYSELKKSCGGEFVDSVASAVYRSNVRYLSLYQNVDDLLLWLERAVHSNYSKVHTEEYYLGCYLFILHIIRDGRFNDTYRRFVKLHKSLEPDGYSERYLWFVDLIVEPTKSRYEEMQHLCIKGCRSGFLYHVAVMEYFKRTGLDETLETYSSNLIKEIFTDGVDIENVHSLLYGLSYLSLVTDDELKLKLIDEYVNFFEKGTEIGVISDWIKAETLESE